MSCDFLFFNPGCLLNFLGLFIKMFFIILFLLFEFSKIISSSNPNLDSVINQIPNFKSYFNNKIETNESFDELMNIAGCSTDPNIDYGTPWKDPCQVLK
jgi:hypothetical protein